MEVGDDSCKVEDMYFIDVSPIVSGTTGVENANFNWKIVYPTLERFEYFSMLQP